MRGYQGVHVQDTQAGGDSLEVTIMFEDHHISFFGTKNEMCGLAEDILGEIDDHLEIIRKFLQSSTGSARSV